MSELFESVRRQSATFTEVPTAGMHAAAALVHRRSEAMAQFWKTLPALREPTDVFALQLQYGRQMLDDYAAAITATLAPLAPAASPAPEPAEGPAERAA
jgi:hypothetical protein